jgi:hypothetical protein
MGNPDNSRNRNLTLGDGILFGSTLVFVVAYFIIFNLVTGHFPRGGRFYHGPGSWEMPLGFILGLLGGGFVRFIYKKIVRRKV